MFWQVETVCEVDMDDESSKIETVAKEPVLQVYRAFKDTPMTEECPGEGEKEGGASAEVAMLQEGDIVECFEEKKVSTAPRTVPLLAAGFQRRRC